VKVRITDEMLRYSQYDVMSIEGITSAMRNNVCSINQLKTEKLLSEENFVGSPEFAGTPRD
jgi:hypothetical protein